MAGALGALARWAFSGLCLRTFGSAFPFGTLGENLLGCFLLGMLMEVAEQSSFVSAQARTVLAVGFIGTFTTFSTFEFETFRMVRRGDWLSATANVAANVVIGFVLVVIGAGFAAQVLRWRATR